MSVRNGRAAPALPLDLWHPSGHVGRRLVLGRAGGVAPSPDGDEPPVADFVLVAPSAREGDAAWLEHALDLAVDRVAADGVICVVVGRRRRLAALRALLRRRLELLTPFLMAPQWPQTRHYVSLEPGALGDAAVRHLGARPSVAALARVLARPRAGRALLALLVPGCALVASPRWEAKELSWLDDLDGDGSSGAAISTSSRTRARIAVVLRFRRGARGPDRVVKVALDEDGEARLGRERSALARLGSDARAAGAAVPDPASDARGRLVAAALPGFPAAALLTRRPRLLEPICEELERWLLAWAHKTSVARPWTAALADELLLAPAGRAVAGGLAPVAYEEVLRALAGRLDGSAQRAVAAHNDLTMDNVLVDGRSIGVVDWEAARADGMPLTDLWYAIADALARARGVPHAHAVATLVGGRGEAPPALTRLPQAHAHELELSADESAACFHACWLHHCVNELDRGAPGPFSQVVATVSDSRLQWPAGAG